MGARGIPAAEREAAWEAGWPCEWYCINCWSAWLQKPPEEMPRELGFERQGGPARGVAEAAEAQAATDRSR